MAETKYYRVKEIAQIFSLNPKMVRQYCHADGQKHAFQVIKGGNLYIDLKKFEKWFNLYYAEDGARRI